MTELYNFEKLSCPFKRGTKYYFMRNSGLQNQAVLYVQDTLESEPTVFFDVNALSEDGTTALATSSFSESGKYWAYGLSQKGSDWVEISIKSVEEVLEGKSGSSKYPETLRWVKFSGIEWTHDDAGFFYSRFPKPTTLGEEQSAGSETEQNLNHSVYYHRLGTSQDEDLLVCSTPENPKWTLGAGVSDDGEAVLMYVSNGAAPENQLWYARTEDVIREAEAHKRDPKAAPELPKWQKLINDFEYEYTCVAIENGELYFKTNRNAPRCKIAALKLGSDPSDEKSWRDVVPESAKDVLTYATLANRNFLLLVHLNDVVEILNVYDLTSGKHIREIPLPTLGSVAALSAKYTQSEFFFKFTSYLHPGDTYRFDFEEKDMEKQITPFRTTKIEGYDSSLFETKRLFYTSKDGTKIPLFVIHKKGLVLDGTNPTLLYGYGGFNIALSPWFSTFNVVWMQSLGGVYAVANLRGGGEYGNEWHKAGIKGKKQNVFDDFQAAAEYLIAEKYTSREKLAIFGGSNGGLLVGACINQRPDLFRAAVAAVGVMDMLNFHRYTIGHAWTTDYGCADSSPEEFEYLLKYSPVHNINASAEYPSTLLTTADHDDRVVPLHSYKYIAALQTARPHNVNPLLILIDTKSGHSAGKPTSKVIEEKADIYSFLAIALNISWQD